MRNRHTKTKTWSKNLKKCKRRFVAYNEVQYKYGDVLDNDETIVEIRCNVPLEGCKLGDFSTDFVCIKGDGELLIVETILKKNLVKPLTAKQLDESYRYWKSRGVKEYRVVLGRTGNE